MRQNNPLIEYGETVKLDAKDKKILTVLDKNARSSIADISRITGIQRDSVLYRINRMKEKKVIRFFHTVLNPSILGYPIYTFVNFTLHNLSEEKERAFLGFLKAHSNIVYVAKTTGKWDVSINIAAKDLKHFDEVMSQIRMKFSGIIKDYETASIIQEHTYDCMVGLVESQKREPLEVFRELATKTTKRFKERGITRADVAREIAAVRKEKRMR